MAGEGRWRGLLVGVVVWFGGGICSFRAGGRDAFSRTSLPKPKEAKTFEALGLRMREPRSFARLFSIK